MAKPVNLKELVEEMDMQMEDYFTFVNRKSGEIVTVSGEEMSIAEEMDSAAELERYPDWRKEVLTLAVDIIENGMDYEEIPNSFDINEYRIMEEFAFTVKPESVSDKLSNAIQGRGAFRRFKDMIIDLGVADDWYSYKERRLTEKAIEWCEEYGIPYERKDRRLT